MAGETLGRRNIALLTSSELNAHRGNREIG